MEGLPDPALIEHVQIFGERCSGTNYLTSLIRKNFADVEITKAFGGKHWFVKDHLPRCRPNRSTDHQCVRPLSDSDDTLFLVMFRVNPDYVMVLFTDPIGKVLMAGAVIMQLLGAFVIKKIITIKV